VDLSVLKDVAIVGGTIVALTTFLTGVLEYARQSNLRRVEYFVEMRRRFLETSHFQEILRLLSTDDPELKNLPIQDRRNFGGFLEEVALMVNSRMISRKVASYMFGPYVILTDRSVHFWEGMDRTAFHWQLFNRFAKEMAAEAAGPVDLDALRL